MYGDQTINQLDNNVSSPHMFTRFAAVMVPGIVFVFANMNFEMSQSLFLKHLHTCLNVAVAAYTDEFQSSVHIRFHLLMTGSIKQRVN